MKKNSLLLGLITILALAGCNKNEVSSSSSNNNTSSKISVESSSISSSSSSSVIEKKTEAEIFVAFKNSVNEFNEYQGSITMDIGMDYDYIYEYGETNNYNNSSMREFFTYNPETKQELFIIQNEYEMNNSNYWFKSVNKQFIENGRYYRYVENGNKSGDALSSQTNISKRYTELTPEVVKYQKSSVDDMDLSHILNSIVKSDSLLEIKTAYETVLTELFEKEVLDSEVEQVVDVSATHNDDDTLEINLTYGGIMKSNSDTVTGNGILMDIKTFKLKDGKISDINIKSEYTWTDVETETNKIVSKYSNILNVDFELTYEFDQEAYDSYEVSLPKQMNYISSEEMRYDKEITIDFGNFEKTTNFYSHDSEPTISDAVEEGITNLERNLNLTNSKISEKLYLDEERTKEFDPETITTDEYYAIDKLYGSIDVAEGNAIVVTNEKSVYDISKNYDIVCPTNGYNGYSINEYVISETPEITINNNGSYNELKLDGVEVEDGHVLTLEDQKMYNVEKIATIKDENASSYNVYYVFILLY